MPELRQHHRGHNPRFLQRSSHYDFALISSADARRARSREPKKPIPTKPSSSMTQVEASGTADTAVPNSTLFRERLSSVEVSRMVVKGVVSVTPKKLLVAKPLAVLALGTIFPLERRKVTLSPSNVP